MQECMIRGRERGGEVFGDRKDRWRSWGCYGVFLLGAGDAGYPQHVLLHRRRAGCVGDSKQTARSAPQHTSVQ